MHTHHSAAGVAKVGVGQWLVRGAVAFVFIASGFEKFGTGAASREWITIFARIGFGDWFRYATGVIEIAGGALLLVPSVAWAGTALLVATMVGAIAAHIFVLGDPFSSIVNIVLIAVVLAAGYKPEPENEEMTRLELR